MSRRGTARRADTDSVQVIDEKAQRLHQRVRIGGDARLVIDHPNGLVTAIGELVDLSEGGCQVRFHKHVDPYLAARLKLELAGKALWLPVVTRWVRRDAAGWTVGCAFDRPTAEKCEALRAVLSSHAVDLRH